MINMGLNIDKICTLVNTGVDATHFSLDIGQKAIKMPRNKVYSNIRGAIILIFKRIRQLHLCDLSFAC